MDFHISLVGRNDLAGEIYRHLRRAILERPTASSGHGVETTADDVMVTHVDRRPARARAVHQRRNVRAARAADGPRVRSAP